MSVGYEFIPSRAILVFQAPENLQADVTLNKTKKLREVPAGSYWCLKALISILKILFLREGWAPISDHYQHFFFSHCKTQMWKREVYYIAGKEVGSEHLVLFLEQSASNWDVSRYEKPSHSSFFAPHSGSE